jgi:hypothetical protein
MLAKLLLPRKLINIFQLAVISGKAGDASEVTR